MIELQTLGDIAIHRDGRPITGLVTHRQKLALLVYLAVEGPVTRDHLLAVFWPEKDEDRARHSLSQALYELKREVGEDAIRANGDRIGLAEAKVTVDARRVEAAGEAGDWGEVVGLYGGPFLDDFALPGAPEFEKWSSRVRTRLARHVRRAFASVVEERLEAGERSEALNAAWRWAALEPLEDEAQHILIALLAQEGKRAAALEQYEAYRERLARELEVEPLEETIELVERIRAGDTPGPAGASLVEAARAPSEVREPVGAGYGAGDRPSSPGGETPAALVGAGGLRGVVQELTSRRVVHVVLAYVAMAWLAIDGASVLIERAVLPEWVFEVTLFFLVIGLPFAALLAWAREEPAPDRRDPARAAAAEASVWPRWVERIHGGHVLIVLSVLAIAILGGRFLLQRGVALEAGLPDRMDVAVLPPTHVDDDPRRQAFSEGLVETLASSLTRLQGRAETPVHIVPMSEVRARDIASASEARRVFGVNLAITSSVQSTGDSVQVTANLVHTESLRQLRSVIHKAGLANTATLQDSVVLGLARILGLSVQPGDRAAVTVPGSAAPHAHEFYLQGRGYLARYEDERNLDLAIQLFQRALDTDPDHALAHAGLGEAYRRKFDLARDSSLLAKAREAAARAIALDSTRAPVHVTLGLLEITGGNYETAETEFRRALELDPTSSDAYRGLGRALANLGRPDAAEAAYRKAIEFGRRHWTSYNQLGRFYWSQARFQEAAELFRTVIELTPDNYFGHLNLGATLHLMGQLDSARAAYERSLALRPTWDAYTNLGSIEFSEGRYEAAARLYERALEMDDRDYRLWYNLATAYAYLPDGEERARDAYRQAAEQAEAERQINPRDPELLTALADCYANLGRGDVAYSLVQEAADLPSLNVHQMFRVGEMFEELGNRERALEWIGRALENGMPLAQIDHAPALDELRSDPRFQELARRHADSGSTPHSQGDEP